jgi:DNA-binding YbaB/EbfC family protein
MSKGFSGMPGGGMNQLMKQAQKMQRQMQETQEELKKRTFDVTSGGGAVKITITGGKTVEAIKIDPAAVDPDDVETLEDLILTAVNEAFRQADELVSREMSRFTGGLGLPGGLF